MIRFSYSSKAGKALVSALELLSESIPVMGNLESYESVVRVLVRHRIGIEDSSDGSNLH